MKAAIFLLFIAFTQTALPEATIEEQVKDLAQSYNQVEAQLDRSIHYVKKTEAGGATTIRQAWFNGTGNLLKVAVERADASGRELTEYVSSVHFTTPLSPNVFMLVRQEHTLPDGGTRVDESRRFFSLNYSAEGSAIRELRKSATFKAGESTDTQHVPNIVVQPPKLAKDQPPALFSDASKETGLPNVIAYELKQAGPPVSDPFSKVKGDSDKFRLIDDSASPDGRYALALGLGRENIKWDNYLSSDKQSYNVDSEEDVCNYVVDLVQQRILGKTGSNHAGTQTHLGRNDLHVLWSPDSTTFALHQSSGQWSDIYLIAGKIAAGPKLAGVTNLLKDVNAKTYAFAKKRPASAALWTDLDQVDNGGVVQIRVDLVVPRGKEREGETLASFLERLSLHEKAAGLGLESVQIKGVSPR